MLFLFSTAFAGGGSAPPDPCEGAELVVRSACTVAEVVSADASGVLATLGAQFVQALTTPGTTVTVTGCALKATTVRVVAPGYTQSFWAAGDRRFYYDLPGSSYEPYPHTSGYVTELRDGQMVVTAAVIERLNPFTQREQQVAVVSCAKP
jgi:hypothetical protein